MIHLIIKHGKTTVRRPLGEQSLVIGRDPDCQLHFPDKQLSRHHARFERTPSGIRLVDLGSRNGTWVNKKKIKEANLQPGDVVVLGDVYIKVEVEPAQQPSPRPEPDAQDAKVKTVLLPRPAGVSAPKPKEKPAPSLTAPLPEAGAAGKTVQLPISKGRANEAATRILRAKAVSTSVPDTAMLPRESLIGPSATPPPSVGTPAKTRPLAEELRPREVAPSPTAPQLRDQVASWSWSFRFLLLALGLGLVVYFVLAWPLMRTLGNELREESLLRGRALLNLLAATNGPPVGQGRFQELTVDAVTREERVKEAVLLDLNGRVLAPSARSEEMMVDIEGIEPATKDIRTFYIGRKTGNEFVMAQPLFHQGRRVGVAVLVYEVATAAGSWGVAVLFLGFLVLLMGVGATVVLGKRMTLTPIGTLRDDVEAVVKGDAEYVPSEQAFTELSDLAESVNRLIDRAGALHPSVEPYRPVAVAPEPERRTPPVAPTTPLPPTPSRPATDAPSRLSEPSSELPGTAKLPMQADKPAVVPPEEMPNDLEAAKFWVDESFSVIRAEEPAHALVGCAPGEMEGKHLIEAIREQRVLEVVLDAINALADAPSSSGRADSAQGPLNVSAGREGTTVVVSLKKL